MTDKEATRTTFVRTRPALHEDKDEVVAESTRPRPKILASKPRWPQRVKYRLGVHLCRCQQNQRQTTAHQFSASRFVSVCALPTVINSSCRATGSAPTAVGRSLLLAWWCSGTRCRTTCETLNSARTLSDNRPIWRRFLIFFLIFSARQRRPSVCLSVCPSVRQTGVS